MKLEASGVAQLGRTPAGFPSIAIRFAKAFDRQAMYRAVESIIFDLVGVARPGERCAEGHVTCVFEGGASACVEFEEKDGGATSVWIFNANPLASTKLMIYLADEPVKKDMN